MPTITYTDEDKRRNEELYIKLIYTHMTSRGAPLTLVCNGMNALKISPDEKERVKNRFLDDGVIRIWTDKDKLGAGRKPSFIRLTIHDK